MAWVPEGELVQESYVNLSPTAQHGTLVNGRQLVEPATLREGDEVQIGDVVMKVNRR